MVKSKFQSPTTSMPVDNCLQAELEVPGSALAGPTPLPTFPALANMLAEARQPHSPEYRWKLNGKRSWRQNVGSVGSVFLSSESESLKNQHFEISEKSLPTLPTFLQQFCNICILY